MRTLNAKIKCFVNTGPDLHFSLGLDLSLVCETGGQYTYNGCINVTSPSLNKTVKNTVQNNYKKYYTKISFVVRNLLGSLYRSSSCSSSTRPLGARCQSNSKSAEMVMAEGTAVLRRNRPGTKAKVKRTADNVWKRFTNANLFVEYILMSCLHKKRFVLLWAEAEDMLRS